MPMEAATTIAYDQTVERTLRSLIHSERTIPGADSRASGRVVMVVALIVRPLP